MREHAARAYHALQQTQAERQGEAGGSRPAASKKLEELYLGVADGLLSSALMACDQPAAAALGPGAVPVIRAEWERWLKHAGAALYKAGRLEEAALANAACGRVGQVRAVVQQLRAKDARGAAKLLERIAKPQRQRLQVASAGAAAGAGGADGQSAQQEEQEEEQAPEKALSVASGRYLADAFEIYFRDKERGIDECARLLEEQPGLKMLLKQQQLDEVARVRGSCEDAASNAIVHV